MSLTLEDIRALENRWRDPVVVGDLPYEVCELLQLGTTAVYLSLVSLLHIRDEHPDMDDITLLRLPFALRNGLIVQETKKSNHLLCCYQPSETEKRFIAALKIAKPAREVYVSSFYRGRERQTRSILKRGKVLKTHD